MKEEKRRGGRRGEKGEKSKRGVKGEGAAEKRWRLGVEQVIKEEKTWRVKLRPR